MYVRSSAPICANEATHSTGGSHHEALHASGIDGMPAHATALRRERHCMEEETIDLMTGAHHQEPYASLNPNRQVPLLEDGDFRLTEGSAILKYLADKYRPAVLSQGFEEARQGQRSDGLDQHPVLSRLRLRAGLSAAVSAPQAPQREAHAGAVAWGQQGAKKWLQMLNDHWIGPNNQYLVGDEHDHRRLFRRRLVSLGELIGCDLGGLPQHQALARQHEEAEVVAQGQ